MNQQDGTAPTSRATDPDNRLPVLVIPALFPSGAEGDYRGVYTLDYIESVAHRCLVSVITCDIRLAENSTESTETFRIHRRRIPPIWKRLGPLRHIARIATVARAGLRITDARLIHAHGAIFGGVPALIISMIRRIPYILTVHTGPFSKLTNTRWKRTLTKYVMERAQRVLVVSEDLRRQVLEEGISDARICVSYNPVDTDLFDPNTAQLPRSKTVLFVSRLEAYKGALRTARAFAAALPQVPGWELVIIGDGPEKHAISAFLETNPKLQSKVRMLGGQPKQRIAEEMLRASLFAFPSEHETFGLVAAEAMACGLPVIVGNNSAPAEFVDESCGVRIPPLDEAALARGMTDMIKNIDKYDRRSIRDTVVQRFGLRAFGAAMVERYEQVLQECAE